MVNGMGALNIKNDEAHRLATEIAAQTGDSLTGAVLTALREKRAALAAAQGPDARRHALIRAIAATTAADARAAGVTADHDDFYDKDGFPS
jgi:antitoxin VapB